MRAALIAFVGACSFNASVPDPSAQGDADVDAPPMLDAYFPDAPQSCPTVTPPTCVPGSNILRECRTVGQMAIDVPCAWGCMTSSPNHCGKLVPSGGGVVSGDLENGTGLENKAFGGNVTFDTVTGEITGGVRPPGVNNIANGIEFKITNNVGVFRFNRLVMQAALGTETAQIRGTNALAIVSMTTIELDRVVISAHGECAGTAAVAGGKPGGLEEMPGGMGGAAGALYGGNNASGGAGGGFGKAGGNGGRPNGETAPTGGPAFGNAQIVTLTGGGGGGGGGGKGNAGVGGGGGGAIQLVANGGVKLGGVLFAARAGIDAGGCGGKGGTSMDAGGGGGAGGAVLIEAPSITLSYAGIAVNGGGGGGGHTGGPGNPGPFDVTRAAGGMAANGGGPGAAGGAAGNLAGGAGATNNHAGGGGGGVGWIRLNTITGAVSMQNVSFVSPGFGDANTTATRGMPVIQ